MIEHNESISTWVHLFKVSNPFSRFSNSKLSIFMRNLDKNRLFFQYYLIINCFCGQFGLKLTDVQKKLPNEVRSISFDRSQFEPKLTKKNPVNYYIINNLRDIDLLNKMYNIIHFPTQTTN